MHLTGLVQEPLVKHPRLPGSETRFPLLPVLPPREAEEAECPTNLFVNYKCSRVLQTRKSAPSPRGSGFNNRTMPRRCSGFFQAKHYESTWGTQPAHKSKSNGNRKANEQTRAGGNQVRSTYLPGLPVCFASKGQENNRKWKQNRESGQLLGKQEKNRLQQPARQSTAVSSCSEV